MPIVIRKSLLCLALAVPLALVACSREAPTLTSGEGILGYVPADTPYVFAALEPLPEEIRAKFAPSTEAAVRIYPRMLKAMLASTQVDAGSAKLTEEERERYSAMIDELAGMITADGIPAAGIDSRESVSAFYGVGLLPVVRITLTDDGTLFNDTFAKLEERAGQSMDVATIDGHSYRYAGNDKGRLIVAVIDSQLVISLVPANLPDDLLKSVLGLTPPANSIADSGGLAKLAEDHGYLAHGLGMIDVQGLAATFLDEQTGVNQWLLETVEHDTTALTDVCKAEIRSMTGIVPRVSAGYTGMSPESVAMNVVFELRSDLAAGLQAVTAPVPGLGHDQGGLFSFGMGFDLAKVREFYGARLDAMEADPYECDLFADLQAGVAQGRAALQQPLPPVAYGIRGFLAVVEDLQGFDLEKKQPPTKIDMRFLLASENPQGLLAMGAMFSPQVASLNLQPDAKPMKLELPMVSSSVGAAYIAMSEDALALSVGEGVETKLTDMLQATSAQPAPFMSMGVDAGRYYGLLGDAIANAAETENVTAEPTGMQSAEMLEASSDAMKAMAELLDRLSFDIRFTERGIEIPSRMSLAE